MNDPITAARERPRTLSDVMSAAAFPTLVASIEARHYHALIDNGVPPEQALELTKTAVVSLLDNAAAMLTAVRGVTEALSER